MKGKVGAGGRGWGCLPHISATRGGKEWGESRPKWVAVFCLSSLPYSGAWRVDGWTSRSWGVTGITWVS